MIEVAPSFSVAEELARHGVALPGSATAYEKIKALFNAAKGQVPTRQRLAGWHLGGIIRSGEPAEVKTTSLLGFAEHEAPGGGPLLGDNFKLVEFVQSELPPELYEPPPLALKPDVNANFTFADFSQDGVLFSRKLGEEQGNCIRYELRVLGDIILLKAMYPVEKFIPRDGWYRWEYTTEMIADYAYYFKKVIPAAPPERKPPLKIIPSSRLHGYDKELYARALIASLDADAPAGHADQLLELAASDPALKTSILERLSEKIQSPHADARSLMPVIQRVYLAGSAQPKQSGTKRARFLALWRRCYCWLAAFCS